MTGRLPPAVFLALALAAPAPAAGEVFEPTKVWPVHITLPAAEYQAMQPPPPKGPFGFGGGAARPPGDPREFHKNEFGVDLAWGTGSVTVDGQAFGKVGVRYKGNGTLGDAARTAKKSFKVDLDKYDPDARFRGLRTLNLHCGVADPSRVREALGYAVYRAAGVPAPRTTFADVRLTVPGKFDAEPLGLYTLTEDLNNAFLKDRFGTDKGLLMKPTGVRDLDFKGDDWAKYEDRYHPRRDATPAEQKRVMALARLVHKADDAGFAKGVGDYLDVDAYLRFLAATAFVVNPDGPFGFGHNYYLYLQPKTGRVHFLPWDLDRAFANFPVVSAAKQADLSLIQPYSGGHKLTERLFAVPGVRDRYLALVRELTAGPLSPARLNEEADRLEALARRFEARDAAAAVARKDHGPRVWGAKPPELRWFLARRSESVAEQLAGRSKGYVPPASPKPGDFLAGPILETLDTDKDGRLSKGEWAAVICRMYAASEKDERGCVTAATLADGINRITPKPAGEKADDPPPGGGFGAFLSAPIVRGADADKDGAASLDELLVSASALFDDADPDRDGKLNEEAVGRMLNRLLGPPPPAAKKEPAKDAKGK